MTDQMIEDWAKLSDAAIEQAFELGVLTWNEYQTVLAAKMKYEQDMAEARDYLDNG